MRWARALVALSICAVMAFAVFGCRDFTSPEIAAPSDQSVKATPLPPTAGATPQETMQVLGDAVNAGLAAAGANYRVAVAEWFGVDEAAEDDMRLVFIWNVGNKQLGHHFVPGDTRRTWGAQPGISYIVDDTEGATTSGLTVAQTTGAIDNAMNTWDNVTCSTIPLARFAELGIDIGVVEFQNGLGGLPFPVADISHCGWLPAGILNPNVLGVTFTFIFIDGMGNPTDVDNNGKLDTAFREILYNDAFNWAINMSGGGLIDVETVALHEAGHGLSQAHFGSAFLDASLKRLHFAPRAVMNAAYSGIQQTISETDNAGHCSIWSHWPNN